MNTNDNTVEKLIEEYHGITSFENVFAAKIGTCDQNLQSKYSKLGFFQNQLNHNEQRKIHFYCSTYNMFRTAKQISLFALTGGFVGALAGAVYGYIVNDDSKMFDGAAIGLAAGGFSGLAVSYANNFISKSNPDLIEFYVSSDPRCEPYMNGITAEQYTLYYKFFCNHIRNFLHADVIELAKYICPITLELAQCPVFAPFDTERKTPFERAAIIQHLDHIEEQLQRAEESGSQKDYIENIRISADPFRRGYFTKDQLVYDMQFAQNVIKFLRRVNESMVSRLSENYDPLMAEAGMKLIQYYQQSYKIATVEIVRKFRNDLWKLGATFEQTDDMGKILMHNLSKV